MKFQKGQVLVELLLAFAVSSIALVSMAQVATKSLSNATYSKSRSEANKYAVQAIEWVRNQKKQTQWATFMTYNNNYCLNQDLTTGTVTFLNMNPSCAPTLMADSGSPTIFTRRVIFTPTVATNQQQVVVTVSWPDKGPGSIQSSSQTIIFKQY